MIDGGHELLESFGETHSCRILSRAAKLFGLAVLPGAAVLHGAVGDHAGVAPPLVIAALMVASYVLRERWRAQQPTG